MSVRENGGQPREPLPFQWAGPVSVVSKGTLGRLVASVRRALTIARPDWVAAEVRRRTAWAEALSAIVSAGLSLDDVPALLASTIDLTLRALGCDAGAIALGGTHALRGTTELGAVAPLLDRVQASDGACAVDDWTVCPSTGAEALAGALLGSGVRASLCAPLLARGRAIGAIAVCFPRPRAWSADERRFVEAVGRQTGTMAERLQQLETARRRAAEQERRQRLGQRLRRAKDLDDMYRIVVEETIARLAADHGALALATPDRQTFTVVYSTGIALEQPGFTFSAARTRSGGVLKTGLTFVSDDFASEATALSSDYPPYHASGPLVIVPVRSEDRIIGTLRAARWSGPGARPFSDTEVQALEGIAETAGAAIHHARLYDQLEQSYLEMVRALAKATDARDSFTGDHGERLAVRAAALARAMGCSDEATGDIRWAALLHDIGKLGVPDAILRKPDALTDTEWHVIRQHPVVGAEILRPVQRLRNVVPLVRHHQERWDGSGYPDGLAGDAIPLGARVLAVVDAYSVMSDDRVSRSYGTRRTVEESLAELRRCAGLQFDPDVVEAFCRLVADGMGDAAGAATDAVSPADEKGASAADIAQSLSYGQRAGRAVPAMAEVGRRLLRPLDLTEVLDQILLHIQEVFGYPICSVFFVDEQTQELQVKAQRGYDPQAARAVRLRVGRDGIVGWVAGQRRAYYAPDVTSDPLYVAVSPVSRSLAAFPLIVDDRVIGVLNVESPAAGAFPAESREFLDGFAVLAGLAILRAQRDENLSRLALTDGLTGLANHRALWDALEREIARARRGGRPVSVMVVEIDRFKRFNDRLGHLEGDVILRAVAQTLRNNSRAMDLVTRFGGDEFVVLLPDAPKPIAAQIAERVRGRVEQIPVPSGMQVTVSVGLATMPEDGDTAKALIDVADQTMYNVKRAGGNGVGST